MGALVFFAILFAAIAAFDVLAIRYGADSRVRTADARGSLLSFEIK
jgi:hypothetical protein